MTANKLLLRLQADLLSIPVGGLAFWGRGEQGSVAVGRGEQGSGCGPWRGGVRPWAVGSRGQAVRRRGVFFRRVIN